MYVGPVRRKKISLWVLVLIVLFIIALVFTVIHIFNSSKANTDSSLLQENIKSSGIISQKNTVNTNTSNIGQVSSFTNFYDIDTTQNTTNQVTENQISSPSYAKQILELHKHKYTFDSTKSATLLNENACEYIQYKSSSCIIKFGTDECNYSELKNKPNLKKFLETYFEASITSDLKTGTIKNADLILCTISENSEVAYLLVTPLNNSEILYLKIYDLEDKSNLIKDLSEPIDEISSIKASIQ